MVKLGYMEKLEMKWYEDKELSIIFDSPPHVCVRYVLPSSTPEEIKSIMKYPFICKTTLKVRIFDYIKKEVYNFSIPKGYCYDGATISRFFWRVIGASTDNTFLIAALIHDWCCEQKDCVNRNRLFSSKVFKALLIAGGVSEFKAQIMFLAVDAYQRFCNW